MPAKTGGSNSSALSNDMGEFVSDSSLGITERPSAWSFMVSVAGLRWDELLNTAPTTTVLMKEGLIGFAAKTKTAGKSEGRRWGSSEFSFPNEKWRPDGFLRL